MRNLAERYRSAIAAKVRDLRRERRWTQAELAKVIGLSQNRLSEIEGGAGSFSAEQLLLILRAFNVTIDAFAPAGEVGGELQNALARLGATHLAETAEALPTERLREALAAVRETIASAGSPRQIAALAPVLVNHAEGLNFAKLSADLGLVGLSGRLGWVVENVIWAIDAELAGKKLSPRDELRYRRARFELEHFLSYFAKHKKALAVLDAPDQDVLDPGISPERTFAEVKKERSAISRAWRVVTRLQPEDFRAALEAARGGD